MSLHTLQTLSDILMDGLKVLELELGYLTLCLPVFVVVVFVFLFLTFYQPPVNLSIFFSVCLMCVPETPPLAVCFSVV